ncbi:MAG: hypothetical protein KAJ55_00075 [Anaerolineales bacterium]|nr:hypothetical protein [Anaerolineales bacterium]
MSENDGGPAFGHGDPTHGGDPGMSLRDWFAGQALAGMDLPSDYHRGPCNHVAADRAYTLADQMLRERRKEQ